jgi:hypothetical protein
MQLLSFFSRPGGQKVESPDAPMAPVAAPGFESVVAVVLPVLPPSAEVLPLPPPDVLAPEPAPGAVVEERVLSEPLSLPVAGVV